MKYKLSLHALVMVLASIAWPLSLHAQALGLAPAQVVQTFKPGVPFQFELTTANSGTSPVEMSVEITDLWYNDKNEKTFGAPGTSPHSAANWIQFVPEHFNVAAHGSQKMKAIVTPPADAKGGYYAVLFIKSKPQLSFNQSKDGKSVFTNMRIGCLVLLSAENTEQYKIAVSDLKLTPPSTAHGLDLGFTIENQGNTHVFPLPRLAILDSHHKLVAKAEAEMERFLPGQKDTMHVDWAGTLDPGSYTAVLTISYGEDRIETQTIPLIIPAT
ncbi:MAG TPA: hypothetical protein VG897_00760 [Terriglobales bacterium]|nr:hypothetical protein [Terriglobales bacterium]